jgi:predicted Zn-dependent protease
MSRPARTRLVLVVVLALALLVGPRIPEPWPALIAAAGLGFLAVALWVVQPLRRARRAFAQKRFDDAAADLAAFEVALGTSAWRRAVASLAVGLYSGNPVAVARNTLGAVRLEQGRLDDAQAHLSRALELDPEYAVPWANLALLRATRGDADGAEAARVRAQQLGFAPRSLPGLLRERLAARPPRDV